METKKQQETIIDAPISLSCLFAGSSDSECEENDEGSNDADKNFEQNYEIQTITLTNQLLKIRQFAFHSHNANRVWPGTFALSDYLLNNNDIYLGNVLELGSATGIISIRLAMELVTQNKKDNNTSHCSMKSIVTSDIDDEYGEVEENIKTNFELNGFELNRQPLHVPHTWGTGWKSSVERKLGTNNHNKASSNILSHQNNMTFDTIVASDILLYVSAYPLLVQTLQELFDMDETDDNNGSSHMKFIMSWNRRIKDSKQFFDLMVNAGFYHTFHGNGLYTFVKKA